MANKHKNHSPDSSIENAALRHAGAILNIDLGALQKNWRAYQAMVSKSKNCVAGAVIKAGGYGLDARHVGVALGVAGCKTFFVASIDEGIELRSVMGDSNDVEIFILGCPIAGNEHDLAHYALSPVLNSMEDISVWKKFSDSSSLNAPAALHIDSGMNRLGIGAVDVAAIAKNPDLLSGVNLSLVMSHLACSDDEKNPMNQEQLASFKTAISSIGGLAGVRASISNSSGVFLGPEYHMEMARPGVGLYGVNPTPEKANPMAQVVRLQAKILQVREIDTPQSVGYGATHKADGVERIATIA
ncbi:MAG: alanine racemase, partial [Rhodospirillaceae bacterium]|nr:alanine racemase [Rhodospirillaceae bacterium]